MKTNLLTVIAAFLLAAVTPLAAQEPQGVGTTLPGYPGQVIPYPVSNTIEGKLVLERTYQGDKYTTTEHHYDGLGREVKTVVVAASPAGGNIVTERTLDCMGRDSIAYLPYVPDSIGMTLATANARCVRFYRQLLDNDPDARFAATRTVYDNTPLNLVKFTDEPGFNHSLASTKGHPIRFDYRLNYHNQISVTPYPSAVPAAAGIGIQPAKTDKVKNYRIADDSMLVYKGFYPPSRLLVREKTSQTTDTLSVKVLEYYDQDEHLVAKEVRVNDRSEHFAYYVYDDFGKLRYEIPSIQDKLITTVGARYSPSELGKYCTYYRYDTRGNEILTLRPGRNRIERVYDCRGRAVLTQDGNQRKSQLWFYVKYDDFDRILETHLLMTPVPASYLQNLFRDKCGAELHKIVEEIYQVDVLLSQVHYDGYEDYDWVSDPAGGMKKSYRPFAIPSSLAFVSVPGVVTADELHANNTGLKTYEKVAVLPDVLTDSTAYIERAFYYDKDGLLVQTVIRNHLGGINRLSNRYDDAGNQLVSYESRATGPGVSPDILQTRMTYDDFGRVLTEQKRLGNGPIAKVSYRYDALGRVATMIQGAGKINTSYKYDIAGRTTEQQNELFSMTLATDKPTLAGIPKNYAGQIGECSWSFAGDGYFTSYGYRYTPMGQLQDARTYRNGQLQVASYAEMDLKYDHNDNILSLTRYGNKRIVNDIQYVYDGNRLISTSDNGRTTTYGYDLNGNVISTTENACSYQYNCLNLVEEVRRNGSVSARYKYLADGTKLEVSDAMGCGFLYFGSLIYSKRGTIYTPESVGFTGGRIVCTSAGSEVLYHVTDYLGSVRVVADQNGRALEKINYYPFGKRWDAADLPISGNRYLFNGKEWQATGAVNLLDYGARMYDPNLGRWFVQDPEYQSSNPYAFCYNNPVRFIDPDGKRIYVWSDEKGKMYEWRQYMGKWGFYDNHNQLYDGYEEKFQRIGEALMTLIINGGTGAQLVMEIVAKVEYRFYIRIANESSFFPETAYKYIIEWLDMPNNDIYTATTENFHDTYIPFIALAHELVHAHNIINNKYNKGKWHDGTSLDEIQATHVENIIRAEFNLPLRTYYETPTTYIRLLDTQGRSLYYNMKGETKFRRIPDRQQTERYQYYKGL